MSVTAVIYCAGCGSRLQAGVPKGMVQVCGQTILSRMIRRVRSITEDIVVVSGFCSALVEQHCKNLGVRCIENKIWEDGIHTTTQTAASIVNHKNSVLRIDGDVVLFQNIPPTTKNTIFVRSTGPTDHYQSVSVVDGLLHIHSGTMYPLWSKLELYEPGWFHGVATLHRNGPYFKALNALGLRATLRELPGIDINNTKDLKSAEKQIGALNANHGTV